MWGGKKVSVIFPAYNERGNIGNAVMDFFGTGVVDEVIVVDNNSTDGTADEVLKTPARLVKETKQGYGYALTRGLKEASGDYVIMAEPDGTFAGKDVLKLLAYADDFDMVCGTRTTNEIFRYYYRGRPKLYVLSTDATRGDIAATFHSLEQSPHIWVLLPYAGMELEEKRTWVREILKSRYVVERQEKFVRDENLLAGLRRGNLRAFPYYALEVYKCSPKQPFIPKQTGVKPDRGRAYRDASFTNYRGLIRCGFS